MTRLVCRLGHPSGLSKLSRPRTPGSFRFMSTGHGQGPDQDDIPKPTYRWFSVAGQVERIMLRLGVTDDSDTARLAGKSASIACFSLVGMTALGTLGVDTTPLLTGIGVTGFTLGFALKEIATNFLSGMLLVINRPFRKGQHLKVMIASMPGLEGDVVSIDARYVLLRVSKERGGGLVMVPSVVVYTSPFLVTSPQKPEPPRADPEAKAEGKS